MEIKKLTKQHCKDIAKIHSIAFPDFFLTSFGERFLSVFYKAILNNEDSINIGLFDNQVLIGFAIGSKNNKFFYKNIFLKNFLELGLFAIIPLMKSPQKLLQLYKSLSSSNSNKLNKNNAGMLLSICIDPRHESKGNGRILLNEFENILFQYNTAITLTTDNENNDYVNDFYLRNGYEVKFEFMQGKRKMNYYFKTKKLND